MTYRDVLKSLGAATQVKVLAAHAAGLSDAEFISVAASIIAKANGRAVALADLSLAATLTLQLREPVATLGLLPPDGDPERLAKGLTTILASNQLDTVMALGRMANSEPLTQAARSYSEGIKSSKLVSGWTRGLSGTACELCTWWARDGQVWPDDHEMPDHKGCTCVPVPA